MEAVQEIALPKVKGSTVDQLPENLYVPPKALHTIGCFQDQWIFCCTLYNAKI